MFFKNYNLQKLNTFGVKAKCKRFASFESEEKLKGLLKECQPPFLILGGGSNILLTKDYEGTVLKNEINGIEIINQDKNFVFVKVGAGVPWHDFVVWAIDNDYGGIENLSLIPGSTGAAPMQNIGAYGVELNSVFWKLSAIEIKTGKTRIFNKEECNFGYRYSIFKGPLKNQFIITSVSFQLNKKHSFNISYGAIEQELEKDNSKLSIAKISKAVINIRKSKLPDPNVIGNSGSFFKNPVISKKQFNELQKKFPEIVGYTKSETEVKVAAGWLIEQAGWKGYRDGDAGVHQNQALVLINHKNAKGKEIWNLSEKILLSVKEKYNIKLEREVNVL